MKMIINSSGLGMLRQEHKRTEKLMTMTEQQAVDTMEKEMT
jgi:hypothetical protein